MRSTGYRYIWDLFISHASEDKQLVARPLANLLATSGFKVWFDEGELTLGDSLRDKLDHALANSRFGVLILSRSFFAKKWPRSELDGLMSLDSDDEPRLLPVWHEVDAEEIKRYSPMLSGRLSVRTVEGLEHVRAAIVRSIRIKCLGRRRDQALFRGKPTRRIFFSVPSGSVFATNTVNPDFSPLIVEELHDLVQREDVWKRIKATAGAGGVCTIFRDWASYREHMAARSLWETEWGDSTRPESYS